MFQNVAKMLTMRSIYVNIQIRFIMKHIYKGGAI